MALPQKWVRLVDDILTGCPEEGVPFEAETRVRHVCPECFGALEKIRIASLKKKLNIA